MDDVRWIKRFLSAQFLLQIKFGGPGRAKQTCMMRQCLQPMLPVTAQCVFCNLDGWRQPPVTSPQAKSHVSQDLGPSTLMECSVCYEIAHADCAQKANSETSQVNGVVNEDLPNSWECPTCCVSGKNNDYKVRTDQNQFPCCITYKREEDTRLVYTRCSSNNQIFKFIIPIDDLYY